MVYTDVWAIFPITPSLVVAHTLLRQTAGPAYARIKSASFLHRDSRMKMYRVQVVETEKAHARKPVAPL